MPQWRRRLPNSSGGGQAPEFDVDEALFLKIQSLGYGQIRAELTERTRAYLRDASLELIAANIDHVTVELNGIRADARKLANRIISLNDGDIGDFSNVMVERAFRANLFRGYSREGILGVAAGLLSEFSRACGEARDQSAAEAHAGHRDGRAWDLWIGDVAAICQRYGLPVAARKDDGKNKRGPSPFVLLIHALQLHFDEKYRHHASSFSALAGAISRRDAKT
jgi:hypothetical protein